eukprot:COSAG04_NODE_2331_length_4323_cov_8.583333_3_plen_670_part_00
MSCGSHGTCHSGSCSCEANFIGLTCGIECGCSGHGTQTGIEAARAAGSCSSGSCACEGNFIGEFCEHSCGVHGTSDGHTCTCAGNFIGEFCDIGQWSLGDVTMRSDYNGATVQAVVYTGEATALSWELQHSLCAAAGRATPGSDLSGSDVFSSCCPGHHCYDCQDKYCAYSATDNHVVTDDCSWADQEFTHVSGTLGGGVGYMCAGGRGDYDCHLQVRVEGTAAAGHDGQATLNSGDAVFCSACQGDDCGDHGQCNDGACTCADNYFGAICDLGRLGDMIMRSGHNGALVQAVVTGEAMTLSWELQHSLCAAAGRATPGSDRLTYPDGDPIPEQNRDSLQDKNCAYSAADNYVVTDDCDWRDQEFTHVSGTLGGGVGYMCSDGGCGDQVRVEGTTAARHYARRGEPGYPQVTLNSGDAVFCSACLVADMDDPCCGNRCGAHGECNDGACTCQGDWAGDYCEGSCGEHGTSDGHTCTCEGNFIGEFCDIECGCSGHGTQTNIEAAREAGSCSVGSCVCDADYIGDLCQFEARLSLGDTIMSSGYNGATVQAVEYTGEATALSWELQHSLCAAAGRATPGSDLSAAPSYASWALDKWCAYSSTDNHVVADHCGWQDQEFTHVSGTLGGVGYMCASSNGIDCYSQVRVEGTTAGSNWYQATLNSGDAVFCSP